VKIKLEVKGAIGLDEKGSIPQSGRCTNVFGISGSIKLRKSGSAAIPLFEVYGEPQPVNLSEAKE
jgi:hypothetical protein